LENTVRWELEGNIPLPPEEIYFDYEVVRPKVVEPDHYDVLVIAFPRTIVDQYVSVLKAAGLVPLALESESQSIARALADRTHPDESRIFIDIGASRTSFVLVGGGSMVLTSTVPLSGTSFHAAIAEALHVSPEEAETIKKEVGLDPNLREGKVYQVLKPLVDTLVEEIAKHIDFYRAHLLHHHNAIGDVESIVFTGGDANLIGLDAYIARLLKRPVLIGDSFTALKPVLGDYIPPISRKSALQFTTAIGLAIREMNI
jgi:type IV pilus assembly protein PilM